MVLTTFFFGGWEGGGDEQVSQWAFRYLTNHKHFQKKHYHSACIDIYIYIYIKHSVHNKNFRRKEKGLLFPQSSNFNQFHVGQWTSLCFWAINTIQEIQK